MSLMQRINNVYESIIRWISDPADNHDKEAKSWARAFAFCLVLVVMIYAVLGLLIWAFMSMYAAMAGVLCIIATIGFIIWMIRT
jgi:cation transport ATPase